MPANTQAPQLQVRSGRLVFDKSVFQYQPERPILQAVSFAIEPGQKVAIVGASGAGKSSLVKLLFRFYDPGHRRPSVLMGRISARSTSRSLRQAIGIVPQDTVLFNDSIIENIRYGNPQASDADVYQALEMAHLKAFVDKLPSLSIPWWVSAD